jgi:beta-lactamase class A
MQRRIHYTQSDLVTYSPITEKHVRDGMTISELCAAALQYSDNTAGNLLMKVLGGPSAVTAYARSIGNSEFHLDRWETELNTCIPGDFRDSTTPRRYGSQPAITGSRGCLACRPDQAVECVVAR